MGQKEKMNADANIDSICLVKDNEKYKIFLYFEGRIEFVGGNISLNAIKRLRDNLMNVIPETQESQEINDKPKRLKKSVKNNGE